MSLILTDTFHCTGCGACYNICPVDAITMEKNPQGFLYPHIDENVCVKCGKCERVCPKLGVDVFNAPEPECYAARACDDVRAVSSSGGIFTLLARWVLKQGGVVCGAAMEADYSVHHICVEDESGLSRLRQSKYVQSNTEYIFREVDNYLKQGRKVFFTGCPCQIAAARKYFGASRGNIYYMDILCHGVPSVQMFQDYMCENFDLAKLENIQFRSKLNGWRADQLRVFWKDGTSEAIPWHESAYEEGFQRNICLRDGCEECEFAGHQRQGDITCGDFWRVEEYDPTLNDGKGTSVILVNNETGQMLLDAIKPELIDLQKTPIHAARMNRINIKFPAHPQKERFKTLYPQRDFTTAVMQCRHALYDIGLVGNYTIGNYGGGLTQYALYETLTAMGYSVLMIERPLDAPERPHSKAVWFEQIPYPSYAISRYYPNIAEMKFLNKQCKIFVTGSDQMFNNNLFNLYKRFMVQNFVTDNHLKIAYAASFGHDRIWGEEADRAAESFFIKKFDAFSVREDSAVELCRREFGVEATQVLDPVFLCPMEQYQIMISRAKEETSKQPYLMAYVLDPNIEKEKVLREVAARNNLSILAVSDLFWEKDKSVVTDAWNIDTFFNIRIESWLKYIVTSDIFVTDSFHGMCFAILFHKQFFAIVNKLRGETRFTSITKILGLQDRLVYTFDELSKKAETLPPIDYEKVDIILNKERERSRKWLKNAIEQNKDKRKPMSTFDMLDARCDDLCLRFDHRCDDLDRRQGVDRRELHQMAERTAQSEQRIGEQFEKLEQKVDRKEFEQYISEQYEKLGQKIDRQELIHFSEHAAQAEIHMNERYEKLRRELDGLINSRSWRIGRSITWLPRKIWGGFALPAGSWFGVYMEVFLEQGILQDYGKIMEVEIWYYRTFYGRKLISACMRTCISG